MQASLRKPSKEKKYLRGHTREIFLYKWLDAEALVLEGKLSLSTIAVEELCIAMKCAKYGLSRVRYLGAWRKSLRMSFSKAGMQEPSLLRAFHSNFVWQDFILLSTFIFLRYWNTLEIISDLASRLLNFSGFLPFYWFNTD